MSEAAIAIGVILGIIATTFGCYYWYQTGCNCPNIGSRGSRRESTPLPSQLAAPPPRGYPQPANYPPPASYPPQWYAPGYPPPYPPQMYQ